MTIIVILLVGVALIGLVLKIAKGIFKLILVIILIILIASGSFFSEKSAPLPSANTSL